MDFNIISTKWCNLSPEANVFIVTDTLGSELASEIESQIKKHCCIINFDENQDFKEDLLSLLPSDLVIVLFSLDTFIKKGANKIFSPFKKPHGLKAKYAFIRLGISKISLLQGLSTPKELLYSTIDILHDFPHKSKLHVTNQAGTDITLEINGFTTCSHEIKSDGEMAFLPPSETSSEVIPNTANGKIVIDVTVGQLYKDSDFLGYFGLVDKPITLLIENSIVTEITGSIMATELKNILFSLEDNCRVLVELGHGLSKMEPTGIIGVDESIIDTCHFGIGDISICGVHLDVVVKRPQIKLISSASQL